MTPAVVTRGLTRWYGATCALAGVDFQAARGEVLGFLGPNAAGKSTTMKILTGAIRATSGEAFVAGIDVAAQPLAARRRTGYLPEDTPLYPDMTVKGYLEWICAMRGIDEDRSERMCHVAGRTGLGDVAGKTIGALSRGYRQRVGIAQAIVHEPDVVILDEPTSGLDPNQIVEIRALITELARDRTVILSTHILPEVQAVCDRVVILQDGRVVADDTPGELLAAQGMLVRFLVGAGPEPGVVQDALRTTAGVRSVRSSQTAEGRAYLVEADGDVDLRPALFRLAHALGWPVLEIARQHASLEEVFARLTGEDGH